jgi:resuscitation-promoting factor RpfB
MKKTLCFAAFSAGAMVAGTGIASAQEAPQPSDQPATHPHTVAVGESLSKISQAELGTSDRWVEIFAVNREALPNPDVIEVGQVLAIPSGPVAVPSDLLASVTAAPAPTTRRQAATSTRQGATRTRTSAVRTNSGAVRTNSGGGAGGGLAAIRACESSGNYGAVSANGRYRGAYQFDQQTWQSVGGSGDPASASPSEQDARASRLRSQRGSNPWPNCG